jgi:hypothetical protein
MFLANKVVLSRIMQQKPPLGGLGVGAMNYNYNRMKRGLEIWTNEYMYISFLYS